MEHDQNMLEILSQTYQERGNGHIPPFPAFSRISRCQLEHKSQPYSHLHSSKKESPPFSFANFKSTRWSTGKQWGSLEHPTKLVICVQTT